MSRFALFICVFMVFEANAQLFQKKEEEEKKGPLIRLPKYVAHKESYGFIAGIERGQYTFMELGVERHWKKVRLVGARTIGANANLEYNFGNNIVGYNAAAWVKQGRVNFTYGINLNYITDFEMARYGLGPQIGFRLMGFHFVNGYNFLIGNPELTQVNNLYVGLRYYFPLHSKTTVVNINKRNPSPKDPRQQGLFRPKAANPVKEPVKSGNSGNKSKTTADSKQSKKNNRVQNNQPEKGNSGKVKEDTRKKNLKNDSAKENKNNNNKAVTKNTGKKNTNSKSQETTKREKLSRLIKRKSGFGIISGTMSKGIVRFSFCNTINSDSSITGSMTWENSLSWQLGLLLVKFCSFQVEKWAYSPETLYLYGYSLNRVISKEALVWKSLLVSENGKKKVFAKTLLIVLRS